MPRGPENPHWLKPFHFKKGVSGNVGGKPKVPKELQGVLALSVTELNKRISRFARMTREQLEEAIKNPKIEILDLAIASVFAKSIDQGDYSRLAFLLDRAIGKVPIAVQRELIDVTADTIEAELTPEERSAEINSLIELRDKLGKD